MAYIICICIVFAFSYIADKRENKICVFMIACVLSLFCGLRGVGVGVDTANYYSFMSQIEGAGITFGSDIGFNIASYFLMHMLKKPYYPLLVFAFVTNSLITFRLWDFRKESSFTLMMLIYMVIYYPYTFNIVRQFLAISVIFWGTKYLEREKYSRYLLLNILAATFHTSALICFGFLAFSFGYKTKQKRIKVLSFTIALLIVIIGLFIFSSNIAKYETYFTMTKINFHAMIILKILCVLFVSYSGNIFYNDEFSITKFGGLVPIEKQIHMLYMVGLILSALGMGFEFVNRIGFYFMVFEMPFWGQVVRAKRSRNVYRLIIFMILLYVTIATFFSGKCADNLFYYHTFLSQM